MMNLRNFDLNLLVIFRAIMNRGSIAAAVEEIGLSPSAVSHALARLHVMLNDELFFRTAGGVRRGLSGVHPGMATRGPADSSSTDCASACRSSPKCR